MGGKLPYLLFALSFGSFQLYYLSVGLLSTYEQFAAYLILYSFLVMLFLLFVKSEGSKIGDYGFLVRGKIAPTVAMGLVTPLVFIAITLEPGFFFGFSFNSRPSPFNLGFFLLAGPLVAVAEEAVSRGYILRRLADSTTFNRALGISALLYGIQLTNFQLLTSLGFNGAVQYLFTNTLSAFALGIVTGLYFYKSSWSLLGPVVLRSVLYVFTYLPPISTGTPGWEFTFVFQLLGYAALILLVSSLLKEPLFLARHYLGTTIGPKRGILSRRRRIRQEVKRTAYWGAVGVVLVVSVFTATQYVPSSFKLLAIATGSMTPTIQRGDVVLITKVDGPSQIQKGAIIAYAPFTGEGPIVHRVIGVNAARNGTVFFTTKGDANPTPDPKPVPFSRVVGRLEYAVPFVGFLILVPPLAISLVIAFFIASFLVSSALPKRYSLKKKYKGTWNR